MKNKVLCPVCQVSFFPKEEAKAGNQLTCLVCGALLLIDEDKPHLKAVKFPQPPEDEIRKRVDTFALLKGYTFSEDKELVLEGLIDKNKAYGDFYCPCKLEHVPENICPCLETRKNFVRKEGNCY